MSYVEPAEVIPGQLITPDDLNLLVSNIIDQNTRIAAIEQPGTGAANLAIGSIIMYYGLLSSLGEGWAVCDGLNGTPDLRNLFVIGSGDAYGQGSNGGSDSHTHGTSNTNSSGSHSHSASVASDTSFGSTGYTGSGNSASNFHYHNISGNTGSTGSHSHSVPTSGSNSTKPPYRSLYYIMRIS